mgnify:CR=1 FL=1
MNEELEDLEALLNEEFGEPVQQQETPAELPDTISRAEFTAAMDSLGDRFVQAVQAMQPQQPAAQEYGDEYADSISKQAEERAEFWAKLRIEIATRSPGRTPILSSPVAAFAARRLRSAVLRRRSPLMISPKAHLPDRSGGPGCFVSSAHPCGVKLTPRLRMACTKLLGAMSIAPFHLISGRRVRSWRYASSSWICATRLPRQT